MKKLFYFLMALILFSCENESLQEPEQLTFDETLKNSSLLEKEKSDYDKFMRKFAKTLAKSLENKEMRKEIKNEALLQIDGDYDIIMKDFKFKKIKTRNGEKEVRDILAEAIDEKKKDQEIAEIDSFNDKYKKLQISIPVKCESWDTESVAPIVVFLPADYDESWEEVEGYDTEGNIVKLSNKEQPEKPVVVVGLNERSDDNGDILNGNLALKNLPIDDGGGSTPCFEPETPYSVAAETLDNSIKISWSQMMPPNPDCVDGYKVFRMAENELSFTLVKTIPRSFTRVYYDSDFVAEDANKSFSYYIIAYGDGGDSYPSETVSALAPSAPKPVVSFEASNYAYKTVLLNWENDISQYHTETRLYRTIVNSNPNWVIHQTFTDNTNDFFDTNLTPGNKYHYKIVHVNDLDESNGKYGFVKVPYRDINSNSPVRITKISYTDDSFEPWSQGKPEFRVWVGNADKVTGLSSFLAGNSGEGRHFDFNSATHTEQYFDVNPLFDWNPSYWEDLVGIKVIEYDADLFNDKRDFYMDTKYNKTDEDDATITKTSGVKLTIEEDENSDDCGIAFYNYYDNTNFELSSGYEYGIKIELSE